MDLNFHQALSSPAGGSVHAQRRANGRNGGFSFWKLAESCCSGVDAPVAVSGARACLICQEPLVTWEGKTWREF
jgi:hypothetical protein